MKKKLFFALALVSTISISAQVLEADNYNSYTAGNVGTNVTGTAAGQGGMYLVGGATSDYQIVTATGANAAHGNYLQVTGGSTATNAAVRTVVKNGLATAWAGRTAGNNIIKAVAEIYTGTSTNQHGSGVSVSGADDGIVGIVYNSQSKTINGLAYLTFAANPNNNGYYFITGLTQNTYPANTWISLGFSYNKTTGQITYNIGGVTTNLAVNQATIPAGIDPVSFEVTSSPVQENGTGVPVNTGPTTFGIDNYRVEAANNATLGTAETKNSKSSTIIAIGPNPTVDYLNLITDLKINKAEVYDMSGRKIETTLEGNRINVKNLNAGSYIISIETKDGKTTEKFIKK
ncbi:T9SS type A sorting domain-containing protein [Chryseobacterium arthrosphaerae]|uniref:T9SS type A sorting domain-containing protein n=1 Tax=Chryseobacterium arthrosphaerae TaxID=651561 RepID=UPI0023E1483B|nr:T9SS type A sorting domain-containing protein [Chryseobacterium arthrosphaerae]WES99099.1 T9SS type A sorting domain-containing protein [Chryseobacterium arthrosphaerae]